MKTTSRRHERGLTLVEMAVVMALAALVVMGLIGFYISSQSTWMDGSTQALAQRDATLLVETISERVHRAASCVIIDSPDAQHQSLALHDGSGNQMWQFWWGEGDSLVHQGPGSGDDQGPVVVSRVTRIQFDASPNLVTIRLVEVRAGDGQLVRLASAARMYNRTETTP